ncbi:MAG: DUF5996 family protein [Vulcanimicrobiaceae bacterium]
MLDELPYPSWEPTKTTLHLWCQIVGKIKLATTFHRNHWWNVTLHPSGRGLSSGRMRSGETVFGIDFDLFNHELVIQTNRAHGEATIPLRDGLSVAEFYGTLMEKLGALGIDVKILAKPYGVPMTTPFEQDTEHASYDAQSVRKWWAIVVWSADVFEEYASRFYGKQSPAHVFWHTLDLAMARYSGRRAPERPNATIVEADAYSHEVISAGFWAGDANIPAPTYYTYTVPEAATLIDQPLRPSQATWVPSGSGHLGVLSYDVVRQSADPRATLLDFLQSGYDAGTTTNGWDTAALASTFRKGSERRRDDRPA